MLAHLSALILTYNEAEDISGCLDTLKWANEIIIIDSLSTDNTLEICKNYTDKVYARKFDNFSAQRNFGITKATGDWILFVDADERVTPELKEEITNIITSNNHEFTGYFIPRKNILFNKWIKYSGWNNDKQLRFFMRGRGKWAGIVHEKVEVDGKVGQLTGFLVHNIDTRICDFVSKLNSYTNLEAQKLKEAKKPYKLRNLILQPPYVFFKCYFKHLGYKDGIQGLLLSSLMGIYWFLVYAKLWELYANQDSDNQSKATC
ncbi:MAG TPA: glycosyltransferase family 2 protein [Actinobacteria bacterium]|nr:glycosyltransferase family 2 protein [Actinomycetota bacterium]